MTTITAIIIFIFGTAIGSFLSVLLHRTKKKQKGIILSRSICPNCKKRLKWRYLVPIFSWLFLKGKCGYCGKKISFHYLALEIITGLMFIFSFLHWNFIEAIPSLVTPSLFYYSIDWEIFQIFFFYILQFGLLITIFFYDLMHQEIPDRFSIPAIVLAIIGGIYFGLVEPTSMLIGIFAIAGFFALQFLISKGAWIGGGDIRMGALMGALLGWEKGILALVVAYITGAIFSLILLAGKKANRKSAIAFGPFLIIGTTLAIFYGKEIIDWYNNLLMI